MSRIRIVKGTYTKITYGNHNIYSKGNIITTAGKSVTETGVEGGTVFSSNPLTFADTDEMKPNGWYRDVHGILQFDPNITPNSKLNKGQTYVGATYQVKDKNGNVIENYRKDGSIFFTNQTSAYNRLYHNSKANNNREELGVILEHGVLVLPDYKNKDDEIQPESYGYSWGHGNIVNPLDKKEKRTIATIHTHLGEGGDATPSNEDKRYFGQRTPYKIYMTIGNDGLVHADYSPSNGGYINADNLIKANGRLTNADLLNGYNLSGTLKKITITENKIIIQQ